MASMPNTQQSSINNPPKKELQILVQVMCKTIVAILAGLGPTNI